jgi:hypothetical protein
MTDYLFIGGVADGRRITVPDLLPRFRVPKRNPELFEWLSMKGRWPPFPKTECDDYERKVWQAIGPWPLCVEVVVYLWSEIGDADVVQLLVDNYRRNPL